MRVPAGGVALLLVAVASVVIPAPLAAQQARQGLVSLDDARLFYEVVGTGDPIIVVHGGPGLDHAYLQPGLEVGVVEPGPTVYDDDGVPGAHDLVEEPGVVEAHEPLPGLLSREGRGDHHGRHRHEEQGDAAGGNSHGRPPRSGGLRSMICARRSISNTFIHVRKTHTPSHRWRIATSQPAPAGPSAIGRRPSHPRIQRPNPGGTTLPTRARVIHTRGGRPATRCTVRMP